MGDDAGRTRTQRWVVLLRGVNVGRGQRVPMADWKVQLEGLGATAVRTLLNSGNAVFTLAEPSAPSLLAGRIRQAIAAGFGLDVPVQAWPAELVRAIVDDLEPLASQAGDPSRLLVIFPGADDDAAAVAARLSPLLATAERLQVGAQAVGLWCADGILASRAATALLGRRDAGTTTRNWATLQKIAAAL